MDVLTNPYHIKNISSKLPILLLNGIDDPVSGMGRETIKAEKIYKKFNLDCTLIQYKGMRHQILYENGKNQVEYDILTFIQKHL
jgi:alpha-beta hydrolase superfamily lysophospholipase